MTPTVPPRPDPAALDLDAIRRRLEDYQKHPRVYADASQILYAADRREEALVADAWALVAEVEDLRDTRRVMADRLIQAGADGRKLKDEIERLQAEPARRENGTEG